MNLKINVGILIEWVVHCVSKNDPGHF